MSFYFGCSLVVDDLPELRHQVLGSLLEDAALLARASCLAVLVVLARACLVVLVMASVEELDLWKSQ